MMTEYQKMKFDELVDLLEEAIEAYNDSEYYNRTLQNSLNDAIELAEEIRDRPHAMSHNGEETIAESFVMDMYSAYAGLEIIHSKDFKNPFVFSKSSGGSNFSQGITLNRFVELLGMRQAREGMPDEGER